LIVLIFFIAILINHSEMFVLILAASEKF